MGVLSGGLPIIYHVNDANIGTLSDSFKVLTEFPEM